MKIAVITLIMAIHYASVIFCMETRGSPTTLFNAVLHNDEEKVLGLLIENLQKRYATKAVDIFLETKSGAKGKTPLLAAVVNDNKHIIDMLVVYGADIFASDGTGETPFSLAWRSSNLPAIKALMRTKRVGSIKKMERAILHNLKQRCVFFDLDQMTEIMQDLLAMLSNLGGLSCNWLPDLVLALGKAHEERAMNQLMTALYKRVSTMVFEYCQKSRDEKHKEPTGI